MKKIRFGISTGEDQLKNNHTEQVYKLSVRLVITAVFKKIVLLIDDLMGFFCYDDSIWCFRNESRYSTVELLRYDCDESSIGIVLKPLLFILNYYDEIMFDRHQIAKRAHLLCDVKAD